MMSEARRRCCEKDTDGDGNCPIHIAPGIPRFLTGSVHGERREPSSLVICRSCMTPNLIFVFGSNRAGRHGAGAAHHAVQYHGAVYGIGEGLQGHSYAIPTLGHRLEAIPFPDVAAACERFVLFAEENQGLTFDLTRVGTGLARIPEPMMRHALRDCPLNVLWPIGWER